MLSTCRYFRYTPSAFDYHYNIRCSNVDDLQTCQVLLHCILLDTYDFDAGPIFLYILYLYIRAHLQVDTIIFEEQLNLPQALT